MNPLPAKYTYNVSRSLVHPGSKYKRTPTCGAELLLIHCHCSRGEDVSRMCVWENRSTANHSKVTKNPNDRETHVRARAQSICALGGLFRLPIASLVLLFSRKKEREGVCVSNAIPGRQIDKLIRDGKYDNWSILQRTWSLCRNCTR